MDFSHDHLSHVHVDCVFSLFQRELEALEPEQGGAVISDAQQAVADGGGAGASGSLSFAQHVFDKVAISEKAENAERREAEFALSQMDSALRHVSELAAEHQGALVDAMCAIYCWHYGEAPTTVEL